MISRAGAFRRRHPLGMYVLRRVLTGLVTVLIASILVFLAVLILPGNTAEVILGRNATPEALAAVNDQIGLGDPIWTRYLEFFGNFVIGDFGVSTASLVGGEGTPVSSLIGPAFENSLTLTAITMVLFIPLMLTLGLAAGLKAGSARDSIISSASLSVSAMPEFLVGTLLILVFFERLGSLPPVSSIPEGSGPFTEPKVLVLPVATLLLVSLAFGSRQLRASVADVVSQDYVLAARINGYRWRHIVARYVLPNAVVPSVQIIAQQMQYLIAGIIVVEAVFNYPGVGTLLVRAISVQDTQEILVVSTILAAIYIAINVVADVICVLLDPRVRTTIS